MSEGMPLYFNNISDDEVTEIAVRLMWKALSVLRYKGRLQVNRSWYI